MRAQYGGGRGRWALILLLPALAWGCEKGLPEVTPEEGEIVAQFAEPAASELLRTLVGRLTQAMEEGGPAGAVEFCSTEAIPLTEGVEAGLQEGMELKRTSFRYRNPANAPDPAEEEALRYFEEAILEGGTVPASYVQRASETELRYYKPLLVADFCLQCHGTPEAIPDEVEAVLRQKYPEDLATGYRAGDLRGVVRISVPADRVGD